MGIERIVFFGTPQFAVPALEALVETGRRPLLVVAQPARRAGRGQALRQPPVAQRALTLGLEVEQPERVAEASFLERLGGLALDLAVVVAYGQIFPAALLELPAHGCVNVHASLLPAWRGAAPIQAAIAAGERETGVTTMLMERGLDTGPILLQQSTPIGARETAPELSARLATLGAGLLVRTLEAMERGLVTARPQEPGLATYAPRLTREAAQVDWRSSAAGLDARLRAQTPWPGLETSLGGVAVKLLAAEVWPEPAPMGTEPGAVLGMARERLLVACGDGAVLAVERLQRPGRRPVDAAEFWRGGRGGRGGRGEHLRPTGGAVS